MTTSPHTPGGPVLVTGAAGFIGFHVARYLLARGDRVVGLDNLNDYYDVGLKTARLEQLAAHPALTFVRADIADYDTIRRVFADHAIGRIVHLAAQAGVRYSVLNPHAYVKANIEGFLNILEACRHQGVGHLVYASSSSVYGGNANLPFSVADPVDHPVSLYAATKKADELIAHSYAHLYRIPCTGLRFFTVYGPWGRPDMALFQFTSAILEGRPIDVYNHGHMERDFTYVDDVVTAVVRVLDRPATPNPEWSATRPDPATSNAPYRIYNVGNHQPVSVLRFIEVLETALGKKAEKRFLPMQPGDVPATYADVSQLSAEFGFEPSTPIEAGVSRFVEWYRDYYQDAVAGVGR